MGKRREKAFHREQIGHDLVRSVSSRAQVESKRRTSLLGRRQQHDERQQRRRRTSRHKNRIGRRELCSQMDIERETW